MLNRTRTAALFAALLGAGWSAGALAQDPDELRHGPELSTPAENTAEGTIIGVDEDERTITVQFEEPLVADAEEATAALHVPEDAELFIGGVNVLRAATLSDFESGQRVEVTWHRDDDRFVLKRLVG